MKHKQNTRMQSGERKLRIAGYASLGMLGLLSILAICPVTNTETKAAESVDVSVHSSANISISVDPDVAMEPATMTNKGAFVSGDVSLTVATNNTSGYQIFMTSANTGQTALLGTNTSSAIESVTSDTLGSNLTGNSWGYTIGTDTSSVNSTFRPIPENANSSIYHTKAPSLAGGDTYRLGFGAHIEKNLPSGTYKNSLLVSVVANYVPTITTMQEISPTICSNLEPEVQYRLADARDGKTYTVAKLKDRNCWMTSNLAYEFRQHNDDGSQRYLTPDDSDVATDWAIPGDAKDLGVNGDGSYTTNMMWFGSATYPSGNKSGQSTGWKEGWGNFYTWGAATAGSGANLKTNGEQAGSSICPKGWRLPNKDEYTTLVDDLTKDEVKSTPYKFTPSGYRNTMFDMVTGVGSSYIWTSSVVSGGDAYYITDVTIGNNGTRNNGLSVRCIAK